MKVKAEIVPMVASWECPNCGEEYESAIDPEDFTNINFGITLKEECYNCHAEYEVEVL